MALAAAALEIPLHLYFLGDAVLQLLDERNPGAARLPPGYRGWASLPDLTEVRASAQAPWLDHIAVQGLELLLQVKSLSLPEMRSEWASCGQVLVL